jgi:glycosyltransferase involved in cell wall biosynthesis
MGPTCRELLRSLYLKLLYFPLSERRCPESFRRWRSLPSYPLGNDAAKLLPPPGQLPDLVFLPMVDWHAPRQRSQQLAHAFRTLGHRCLYLNPHLGRELARPALFDLRPLLTSIEPGILELHTPLAREPVYHHRRLTADEARRVATAVDATLRCFGAREVVLIASLPTWDPVVESIRADWNAPVVVDCHDLLRGFGDFAPELIETEGRMLERAELAIFSSQALLDEHLARHPKLAARALLLRNAVVPGDFALPPAPGARPFTVGYAGACGHWFDFELLRDAARLRPEWKFEVIGRLGEGVSPRVFSGLENLRHLPEVDYSLLPEHMHRFDIGVIPFRITPLTLATNPVKLYEYFACGFPVVTTRLPEVERYGELIYAATGVDEFVRQLDRAAAESDPTLGAGRRQVAARETWLTRCQQLSEALERPPARAVGA